MISAGGTGGGVYPALAVADAYLTQPRREVLWLGSKGGIEAELVGRAGLPFHAIHASGLHGVGWRLPLNALALARGTIEAIGLAGRFRPDTILVTGGFLAWPAAVAGWLHRIPVVVYLPDLEPGQALKAISGMARAICVTAEESRAYFDRRTAGRVVVTGYPTRPELRLAPEKGESLRRLGLSPTLPTVLVTGGSRGARGINRAVFQAVATWCQTFQVVHLTGQLDHDEAQRVRAALPEADRDHYLVTPYLHEMALALAAADLVVSRAGASVLGEYPLFGLPAILIPYPYAWRYQKVNAESLVKRGAALMLEEQRLTSELTETVRSLLADPDRRQRMGQAARSAATPEAAVRIAEELMRISD